VPLLPLRGPLAYFSRCMCGDVIVCRGARVQPGARPRPGDCDGRHRCRRGPGAPQPGSSQDALTFRPRQGRPGDSRHIAWLSAGLGSLCVITPLIRGVMTHNIGKDHFPAVSVSISGVGGQGTRGRGRRERRGRAGQPAGAACPAGTTPATGRPRRHAASRGISQRGP
jgi:hypothetical protein